MTAQALGVRWIWFQVYELTLTFLSLIFFICGIGTVPVSKVNNDLEG